MLKREWGLESNGKLLHLFIPSKTVALIPEFAVEDLHLDRTASFVPAFAEHTDDDDHGLLNKFYNMWNY